VVLGCKRINAGIDTNIADKIVGALDEVRDLVNGPVTEATSIFCHRSAPLLAISNYFGVR
jgi:hypothetical protein